MSFAHGSNLVEPCTQKGCLAPVAALCHTANGVPWPDAKSHALRKTAAASYWRGWDARDAYVAPPVPTPPVVVVEPKHPIPAGAITVPPGGKPTPGKVNVLTGTWPGFSQMFPNGTETTLIVPEGQTVVFDGKGAKSAIVAGGKVNLYGDLRITGYAPTSTENGSNAPVYYGGTAAGSELDGPSILSSAMAGLGFQVPLILTKLTVDGCGYSGILGTTADGTTFGDVGVYRVNRAGHSQDGQLGAIKITRSADLVFSKDVHVEDTGGAHGIWTDVSCRNPVVGPLSILTGAGKPAGIGLLLEETQGGTVAGPTIEGVFGLVLLATGGVKTWAPKVTATSVAMSIQQDRPKNGGTSDSQPNLSQASAPWWAVGNEVNNATLTATGGFKIALMAYADGPAKGMLTGGQMIDSLRGNTFGGSVQLGRTDGSHPVVTDLASALGTKYDAATQPTPPAISALLAA